MHLPFTSPPADDEGRELYQRLVANDPLAPSDLAVAYLDHLTVWLSTRNPGVDPSVCATAAEDAILALIKNPASYNPDKLSLTAYLHMSAAGDLKNMLAAEYRLAGRRASLEAVEHSTEFGKLLGDESYDPQAVVIGIETVQERIGARDAITAGVRSKLSSVEKRALDLMSQGERRTEIYAAALGIEHLAFDEQRKEVKRVKDRLIKRFERARKIHE